MSDDISQYERLFWIIVLCVTGIYFFGFGIMSLWAYLEHKNRVNRERGFSWKSNETCGGMNHHGDDLPELYSLFLRKKLERGVEVIRYHHVFKDDPESKQREIDELNQFIDNLKTHLQNRRVFPRDPEKQTELEKMIINAPPIPPGDDDYSVYVLKDPKSGMYFHRLSGMPCLPPDVEEEYRKWEKEYWTS
jgi:hypothetical protein